MQHNAGGCFLDLHVLGPASSCMIALLPFTFLTHENEFVARSSHASRPAASRQAGSRRTVP